MAENFYVGKILVISQSHPFKKHDANSIILKRLFKYLPVNDFLFYTVRTQSFISDRIILLATNSNTKYPNIFRKFILLILKIFLKIDFLKNIFYLIVSPFLFLYSLRDNLKQLDAVLKNPTNRIQQILVISDEGYSYLLGFVMSRKYNLPFSLYLFDLWRENKPPLFQKIISLFFCRRIYQKALYIFTAGEGIFSYLKKYYPNLSYKIVNVNNSIDCEILQTNFHPYVVKGNVFKILFIGTIYWPRLDTILNLIKAIQNDKRIEFHIFSSQPFQKLEILGIKGPNIILHRAIPNNKILDRVKEFDLLYLPVSFKFRQNIVLKTAFPGKLVEYLVSGVPILIHSPSEVFIYQYALNNNLAFVLESNSINKIKGYLDYIQNNYYLAETKVKNALNIAKKYHSAKNNALILKRYLCNQKSVYF